jgi:hypothetical protein
MLELSLYGFSKPIQARDVHFREVQGPTKRDLGQGTPAGVTMRLAWGSEHPWMFGVSDEFRTVIPGDEPITLVLDLPAGVAGNTRVWTVLHIEDGLEVEVRDASWESPTVIIPSRSRQRLELWFGHPNLFGHTVVALGVAGLVAARGLGMKAALIALSLVLVAASGSRTALGALVVAASVMSLETLTRHFPFSAFRARRNGLRRGGYRVLAVLAATLVIVVAGLSWQARPVEPALQERLRIWEHSLRWISGNVLLGPDESFGLSWALAHPDRSVVHHAHNGLLQAVGMFGLPGATALAAAFAVLAIRGLRRQARSTVAVFGALFVLNTFDSTFLNVSILMPLLIGLGCTMSSSARGDAPRIVGPVRKGPSHRPGTLRR